MVHSFIARVMIGGHISCNFYGNFSAVEKQHGASEAALQSHFEKLNFEEMKKVIQDEGIDCELKLGQGGWDVFLTDEGFETAKRELEGMKLAGGYTSTLKIYSGSSAATVLSFYVMLMKAAGVKFCQGAVHTAERASLRPYAFVTSLLRILIEQFSLLLYTHTPVTSVVSPSDKGGYYTIHTTRGIVKARHIVNATNAWIGHLYPEFQDKIIPTRGQVIHIDGRHLKLDPTGWNFGDEYLIQRPDSSIIFGGGERFDTRNRLIFSSDNST
jgi:hypothetical protein